MGQTVDLKVRKLTPLDAGAGLLLAQESIEEMELKDKDFDPILFNFKVKNMFVTPGVEMYGLYIEKDMIGFIVISETQMLWSTLKKLNLEFLYLKKEFRTWENIETCITMLEKKMIEIGYESIMIADDNPLIPEDILLKRNYKIVRKVYEKENAY
jgi:hypothetical protein